MCIRDSLDVSFHVRTTVSVVATATSSSPAAAAASRADGLTAAGDRIAHRPLPQRFRRVARLQRDVADRVPDVADVVVVVVDVLLVVVVVADRAAGVRPPDTPAAAVPVLDRQLRRPIPVAHRWRHGPRRDPALPILRANFSPNAIVGLSDLAHFASRRA